MYHNYFQMFFFCFGGAPAWPRAFKHSISGQTDSSLFTELFFGTEMVDSVCNNQDWPRLPSELREHGRETDDGSIPRQVADIKMINIVYSFA